MKKFISFIIAALMVNLIGLANTVNGDTDSAASFIVLSMFSIAGIAIWIILKNDNKRENTTDNDNVQHQDVAAYGNIPIDKYTAFNIMKKALVDIGCQPTVNNKNSIIVAYQGENFLINCNGLYATIWDLSWSCIKANDSELPKIREAVNTANLNFAHTVVLGEPDDNGDIDFHTKRDIMLYPSFTYAPEYIKAELNNFFPVKDGIREIYKQLDLKQKGEQRERKPIGFTTQE